MVRKGGLEPPWVSPLAPKASEVEFQSFIIQQLMELADRVVAVPVALYTVKTVSPLSPLWVESRVVRRGGLEPPRSCDQQLLRLPRMPFRHPRT
jgi:hypothetical protein